MNTKIKCTAGPSIMAIVLLASGVSNAHHSHASLNKEDVRIYQGVVTRYSWTMPHVFMKVDGPDENGKIVEYSIEMNHPPSMARKGWSKKSFKPGDRIIWEGPHDHDPDRHYTGISWAERGRDGTRFNMDDAAEGEVTPSTDFTGLWKRSDIGGWNPHYRPPEGWPLNANGKTMVENFDENNNPMVRCGNPGPPKSMIVPYPVSITRLDDDHFVFERELMKEVRTIHIDHEHDKKNTPSTLGFSVARFEDDELVVETTDFTADKWGTHTGIDSSEQKHLIERFSLADGGMHLLAEITVSDPVYLSEPVTFVHRWKKLADREVIQAPCTMEAARLYLEAGYEDGED